MKTWFSFLCMAIVIASTYSPLTAQISIAMPEGEQVVRINVIDLGLITARITATRSTVYASALTGQEWSASKKLFTVPLGRRILDAVVSTGAVPTSRMYAALLDNGVTMVVSVNLTTQSIESTKMVNPPQGGGGNQQFRRILLVSDKALYLHFGNTVYKNQFDDRNYVADTAGLSRANISDVILDDATQTLYAVSTQGFFKQGMSDGSWTKIASTGLTGGSIIHQVRNNFYAVSAPGNALFVSSDECASWTADSTGITGVTVYRMAGNGDATYAVAGTQSQFGGRNIFAMYRKLLGGSGWERIDQNLLNTFFLQSQAFNDVAVTKESVEAGTGFGAFTSRNFGTNWTSSTTGIEAEETGALFVRADGSMVVSTVRGIFVQNKSTGAWTKTFPASGYRSTVPIIKAKAGTLYTVGNRASVSVPPVPWMSADGGSTWTVDSVGMSALPSNSGVTNEVLFADENNTMYYAVLSTATPPTPMRLFTRKAGGMWEVDTAGFGTLPGTGTSGVLGIGTNRRGTVYLSAGMFTGFGQLQTSTFLKRQAGETVWSIDTIGIGSRAYVTSMSQDGDGGMYIGVSTGGSGSKIFVPKSGNGWELLTIPPVGAADCRSVSIDSSKRLYISFGAVLGNGRNAGVYSIAQNDTTWEYAGLDSLPTYGVSTVGDTAWAYTSRGIYRLSLSRIKNPVMILNTKTLDFDSVNISSYKELTFTVSNTGEGDLRVSNIRSSIAYLTATPATFTVVPGASRVVTARFTPLNTIPLNATLRIESNATLDTVLCIGIGFNDVSSVNDEATGNILRLSPQPASDVVSVTFTMKHDGNARFELCDINGKVASVLGSELMTAGEHTFTTKVDGYIANGSYLLRIVTPFGVLASPVVIVR